MKKKLAKIFILFLILVTSIYLGNISYRAGKRGILHLLENILKSPITYETYEFNPLSHIRFSKFSSSPLKADTLVIRFNILDLLFRKIGSINGKNVYLNIDTLVAAYSKGKGGGGVPVFEVSQVYWDSTTLIAGGITYRARLVIGSMRGVRNTLVIPFKALSISFLDNEYRLVTSTVKVFTDSTVLYDVQADSRKIFVKNGKLKILSGGKILWNADSVRYETSVLNDARGRINGKNFFISAKKSTILAKYPLDSLNLKFTTGDFNTLTFEKFELATIKGFIAGNGTVSGLKTGNPDSISYNLYLNLEKFEFPEKHVGFSGDVSLTGKGPFGRFDARLRNVAFKDNSFRQLNLLARYEKQTLFIDFGEIIDPDLSLNFRGVVSRDTLNLYFSGNGYNLASYLKKPFSTGFFKIAGNFSQGEKTKQLHLGGILKDVTFKNINVPYLEAELDFLNENTRILAVAERISIGNLQVDSLVSRMKLSSYHMGNYEFDAFSSNIELTAEGKFYLDSSGVYISNEKLIHRINGVEDRTLAPIFLTWSGGKLNIQADSLHIFKGTLKNLNFELKSDTVTGKVSMEGVDISLLPVNKMLDQGILTGNFELNGTLSNPGFSFKGSLSNTIFKNLEIDTIRSEIIYSGGKILSPITVIKGDRFSIYADFVVPANFSLRPFGFKIKTREPIHGELVLDRIDATVVTDILEGGVYPETGYMQGNLILLGNLDHPELSGKIELKTTNTFIEAFGNEYREIYIQLKFEKEKVEISQIRIDAPEGFAEGRGVVELTGLKPSYLSVLLNLSKFPFARGDIFEGIFNGFLSIQGKLPDDITISGDLFMDEGYVYLSFGKSGGSGKMRPNPLKINLRVSADRRIFLINELADMEFSADLTIVKEDPVTVLISGKLDVIKGTFLYLDRIFIIQEGSIVFNNEPEINPTLNLLGETVVNDTIFIELHVTGNVRAPEIQLTSSPPLSEEDIISLLSFGKLLSEVPLTIRDISLMKTRALNLAEGLISRELQKRLRINELELRTGLAGENPRFTVGLYLSPRVYFRYAHSFEALEKDIYQVKYFLKRNFAIYGERDKEGEISIGIEARYRF